MANTVKLNYVYKEKDDIENNKLYKLEMVKSQQTNMIKNNDLSLELVSVKVHEKELDYINSPIIVLLTRLCIKIKNYWDRRMGLPLIQIKNPGDISGSEDYRATIVPYYVDKNLDSVRQFLEWEDALPYIPNLLLISVRNSDNISDMHILTFRNHQQAVSHIRKDMKIFDNIIKNRKVSSSDLPSTKIQQALGEIFRSVGLIPISNEDVYSVLLTNTDKYKQYFQTLRAKYPNKTIFVHPFVDVDKKVYNILMPV